MEKTLILVKPDAVKRGLIGKIIGRFEDSGLKIVGMKMAWVDKDHAGKHYTTNEEFLLGMGNKTLKTYAEYGKDPMEMLGTKDPLEIGKMVREWNLEFLTSGPVLAVVLEGVHAVTIVRKIVGATLPTFSEPGSIRGMYSIDSPVLANERKRAVRNMIHASGTVEEAKLEIELWFHKKEVYDYHRADEDVMF